MTSPDRYNINPRARRSPGGDHHGSFFQGQGQGMRPVLPPISSAFPTSHFPAPPQFSSYPQQYAQPRSSPGRADYQVSSPQWFVSSGHPYQPSPPSYNYEQLDPRYSSGASYTPSRPSQNTLGDIHSSRRSSHVSEPHAMSNERWAQPAPYASQHPHGSVGVRSPTTLSHPYVNPQHASHSASHSASYAYPPSLMHDARPMHASHVHYTDSEQLTHSHRVHRGTRTNRTVTASTREGSSAVVLPEDSQEIEEEATADQPAKKKRKRATPAQLEVLNAVYERTAFPSTAEREELARQLGMTPRSVQIWFQNKRQGKRQLEKQAATSATQQNFSVSPQESYMEDNDGQESTYGYNSSPALSAGGSFSPRLLESPPRSSRSTRENTEPRAWFSRH